MADTSEEQLIEELQRRLRTSGPMPKREIVVAALAMSRDPSILAATACDDAGVARGSRARATDFSRRITREGLVAACAPPPPPPPPPSDWPHYPDGLYNHQLRERHPDLQPPTCSLCSTNFVLISIHNRGSSCDKCNAILPNPDIYWTSACRCISEDLCHSCTPTAAQVDWEWIVAESGTNRHRGTSFYERDWDKLSVSNCSIDFDNNDEDSEAVIEELKIARSLGLPCHVPFSAYGPLRRCEMGLRHRDHFRQLLLSAPRLRGVDREECSQHLVAQRRRTRRL